MSTVHLHLSVQQMPSGKWVAKVRRDDHGLTRPHESRREAVEWALGRAREELNDDCTGHGEAA